MEGYENGNFVGPTVISGVKVDEVFEEDHVFCIMYCKDIGSFTAHVKTR